MRTKGVTLLLVGIVALTLPGGRLYASCGSAPVTHGFSSSFTNCGPNPVAYVWTHGRGVQRIINPETTGITGTTAGHDSGNKQTQGDGMMLQNTDTGGAPIPGSYLGNTDFSNPGWDGCIVNPILTEQTTSPCAGTADFLPLNYAIGGIDPAQPNVGRLAVLSVDFNEVLQAHLLDNAGAPAVDGDACGSDAFSTLARTVDCLPIPVPTINGVAGCTASGCTINVGVGDVTNLKNLSILDDCSVAEDFALNCAGSRTIGARNVYQGRVLLFKHGACTPSTAVAFDRKAFVYPASPTSGQLTVNPNMLTFSREDTNLNGVLDAAEDGSNGGVVNSRLDPFVISGTTAQVVPVPVPAVAGASDCIFLAMGIMLDAGGAQINPPNATPVGESIISPVVSLNTNPIRAGAGTPVSDQVIDLIASKTTGKGKVDWTTGIELSTSGFNVIGTKKGGGGEIKLNTALISAKEGTTGKGATYSVSFDGGQLKGSSAIYIEVVKTNGSKERFGPASF